MKYIKTYEGLFDVFYSGNKTINKYIEYFKYQRINFSILQDLQYPDGYSGGECTCSYTIHIDSDVLEIKKHTTEESTTDGPFTTPVTKFYTQVNGKKISGSQDSIENLYLYLDHIYRRTDHLVGSIYTMIVKQKKSNSTFLPEVRERCIEFELTKDYLSLDSIALNQLFDFYDIEYTDNICDNLNRVLKGYRTL